MSEEEAEADSFVGQSVAPSAPGIQSSYFQQPFGAIHDPFSRIGTEPPPPVSSTPAVFPPSTMQAPGLVGADASSSSSVSPQNTFTPPHAMPPSGPSQTGILMRNPSAVNAKLILHLFLSVK